MRPFTSLVVVILALLVLAIASPASAQDSNMFTALPSLRTATITGFTRAHTTMALVSEVSAKVVELTVDMGDSVPEDGVVARLDDTFVMLDLEANRVSQASKRSSIEYLAKETSRYRDLVSGENAAQTTLDKLENDLTQARLALQELQVAENRLEEQLSRYTVQAEPGRLVMERLVEEGEWVSSGQTLARVGDFSTLLVPFALAPEEYAWLMAQEGSIGLRTVGMDGLEIMIPATIDKISPAFDPETRKINVELAVDASLVEPRGGLRMEMDMELADGSGAVLVHPDCVELRYDEYWLTREDGGQVKVVVLGQGPGGMSRVSSTEIMADERFVMHHD